MEEIYVTHIWQYRGENKNEIEFAIYRNGYIYHTGLSNCVGAWQTAPGLKIRAKPSPGEFISKYSSHGRHLIHWAIPNTQKVT